MFPRWALKRKFPEGEAGGPFNKHWWWCTYCEPDSIMRALWILMHLIVLISVLTSSLPGTSCYPLQEELEPAGSLVGKEHLLLDLQPSELSLQHPAGEQRAKAWDRSTNAVWPVSLTDLSRFITKGETWSWDVLPFVPLSMPLALLKGTPLLQGSPCTPGLQFSSDAFSSLVLSHNWRPWSEQTLLWAKRVSLLHPLTLSSWTDSPTSCLPPGLHSHTLDHPLHADHPWHQNHPKTQLSCGPLPKDPNRSF